MARRDTGNQPAEQSGHAPRNRDDERARGADEMRGIADEGEDEPEETDDASRDEDEEGTF